MDLSKTISFMEEYSEPCETSKMKFFAKIVNGLQVSKYAAGLSFRSIGGLFLYSRLIALF